jgi:dephospho-CoA kinase
MKKIGITGTIGAGKSTVSILLRRRGKPVFDCDQYARILYQKTNPCYAEVVDAFSEEILDEFGEIDRKKLAAIVFRDEEARKKLNAITHPAVIRGMETYFKNHAKDPLVFAEVPLLVELGQTNRYDEVVLVTCSEENAIRRMMEDRGYSEEEARRRLAAQIDPKVQRKYATFILENDGSIRDLDRMVGKMLKDLGRA